MLNKLSRLGIAGATTLICSCVVIASAISSILYLKSYNPINMYTVESSRVQKIENFVSQKDNVDYKVIVEDILNSISK